MLESPVCILMPLRNDWAPAWQLLTLLDEQLSRVPIRALVIIIDDGSTQQPGAGDAPLRSFDSVVRLRLRRNIGHQRAIAIGLAWAHDHVRAETFVVMDADGEDRPEDVPRLLAMTRGREPASMVFAERLRRSEGAVFRLFYWLYRTLHLALTGLPVRVGNFSAAPFEMLENLIVVSDLWNHYAAAVIKARFPLITMGTSRGTRLGGRSQMNFTSLVTHGLSAIAVFGETVGVRLLIATGVASVGVAVDICVLLALRLSSATLVPAWAGYAMGLLAVLLAQMVTFAGMIAFFLLATRNASTFIPGRDYVYFVRDAEPLPWA